ncbi:MAG: IS200/IS605 family transposase [Bacteroidetes bacterium]|nr:IS200/IS605 family transposase [Bacteroidota bacterium]MCW5895434.1 IS200/IS605 family transposase [Bacteroidota bacterium]
MGQVYYKLFYHAIWRTKYNQSAITPAIEAVLVPFMENKAKRFGCHLHGIGGTEDHIHIAIEIPPAESVSDIIGKLKGSSSYFLNKELQITKDFYWQDGFGVLSFAERDLPKVLDYIQRQKEHHASHKLNAPMERVDGEEADSRVCAHKSS